MRQLFFLAPVICAATLSPGPARASNDRDLQLMQNLDVRRADDAFVPLRDGTFFMSGGSYVYDQNLFYSVAVDPATGASQGFSSDADQSRLNPHAVEFLDGRIGVFGGVLEGEYPNKRYAVIYDRKTSKSVQGPRDTCVAYDGTATALPDGRILFAGGWTNSPTASTEHATTPQACIFDPHEMFFQPVGAMAHARERHTATPLGDGRVLMVGGYNEREGYLGSAEIFDPKANAFTPAGNLSVGRAGHSATLLNSGRVLIAGGQLDLQTEFSEAEIFTPATAKFRKLKSTLRTARTLHSAILLGNGRVVIVGGRNASTWFPTTIEVFNESTETFMSYDGLRVGRMSPHVMQLDTGDLFVSGGSFDISPDPHERIGPSEFLSTSGF